MKQHQKMMSMYEKQQVIRDFEKRILEKQQSLASTKGQIRQALRRGGASRCPVRLKSLSHDIIVKYGNDLADLFCRYPDDAVLIYPYDATVGYQPKSKSDRIDPLDVMLRQAEWVDEWGTRWGHAEGGVGATPLDHPLKDWSQLDDYLKHQFPDSQAPDRMDSAKPSLEALRDKKYCIGSQHLVLFERLHMLRGMENIFMDFYTNPAELDRLADAITQYDVEIIGRWADLGADAVFMSDDWGTQTALMISLEMWRKFFKGRYQKIFDAAHRRGLDVVFHSCGAVTELIPDLIDIGLDVLNPLQPNAMDLKDVARRFGGKVAFFGAVDNQELMVKGTPSQIKDDVRRLRDLLGGPYGNAYMISPSNILTPEVSFENLVAMFEASHE